MPRVAQLKNLDNFSFGQLWSDNYIICLVFGQLQQRKFAPCHVKFAKSISKFCQILNEPFQNGQTFLTVGQAKLWMRPIGQAFDQRFYICRAKTVLW